MILAALNDYYERLAAQGRVPEPGFSRENISYALVFSPDGKPLAIDDLRDTSGKKPRPILCTVPYDKGRTSGIHAYPLWDKTAYAFGVAGGDVTNVAKQHAAFKDRQRTVFGSTDDRELCAFLRLVEEWQPDMLAALPGYGEEALGANFVFRLDGERHYLHERNSARDLWRQALQADDDEIGPCLVTGERAPLGTDHPAIRNVNGAQTSGASLVSFNSGAYESYGHKGQTNASISRQAIFGYTTALNYLLRRQNDNHQRLSIGDATVVFWAHAADTTQADAAERFFFTILNDPPTDEQEASRLKTALERVAEGTALAETGLGLDGHTRFYVLGLAPNAARLSVRFWCVDTLEQLTRHFAQHQQDLALDPVPWKTALPPIWRLMLAMAPNRDSRAKAEDIPPHMAGEMARTIFTGQRYPQSLLSNLVMRFRNDGDVNGTRVALCKAVLVRNARLSTRSNSSSQEIPVSLDPDSMHPGYLLGRLFAELESAQRAALGRDINATIRDRYYGAASATPANVFPILLRNVVHHFSRIRKDKRENVAYSIERKIGDILKKLPARFPKHLDIQDQGQFAIGYYQQKWTRHKEDKDQSAKGDSE